METYPYGFKLWLNKVWHIAKEDGTADKDSTPDKTGLVPSEWLPYFMIGLNSCKAYEVHTINKQINEKK